ncbi:MAG: hypothetical protein IJZ05_06270 [Rikenellaceae bacterium]|nr:hypothetical protein [Rikenellaceae bacterium]
MQINDIKTLVARLGAIVDGWDEQSGAPAVERHIAASLLAELYEAVKFDTALAATEVAKVVAEPEPTEEVVAEPTEEVAEVIDLSDIFGGSFDDDDEEIVEQEVAEQPIEEVAEPESEIEVEPEPEPEIEEQPEVEIEQEEAQSEEEQVLEDREEVVEQPAEIEAQPVEEEEEQPAVEKEEQSVEIETQPVVEEVEQSIETEEQPAEIEAEEQPTETEEEELPVKIEEEEQPAVAEAEKPKSEQASLFDMEIVRRPRSSSGRRVIMSLYGESATSSSREEKTREKAVEPAPDVIQPVEQPADESPKAVSVAERIAAAQTEGPQVLGDVIGAGTTTLAEAVAASQPTVQTVQNDRVNTLRAAIGINDRFIMIRDLFGGDGAAFDQAMDELDAFEDFNECLVYMSTYRWNPNSDGARMLMDLVTRKLL